MHFSYINSNIFHIVKTSLNLYQCLYSSAIQNIWLETWNAKTQKGFMWIVIRMYIFYSYKIHFSLCPISITSIRKKWCHRPLCHILFLLHILVKHSTAASDSLYVFCVSCQREEESFLFIEFYPLVQPTTLLGTKSYTHRHTQSIHRQHACKYTHTYTHTQTHRTRVNTCT